MPNQWDSIEAAAAALNDPALTAADLAAIAYAQAALRPRVVGHPAAYPGLLDWLRGLGDPAVDAAFAQAASQSQAVSQSQVAAQPQPVAQPLPVSQPQPVWPGAGLTPTSGYPQPAALSPQPAAPYPPTGPNQWAGQYPTPMPGPYGPPTAPPPIAKKSRRGLVIGLIAAGLVVVLVVVGVFVVLPRLGGSGSGKYQLAPDFSAAPVAGQRVNTPSDDVELDAASVWVGASPVAGKAVVTVQAAASAGSDGYSAWYPGYDEDYSDGFTDGTAFVVEVDADYAYLDDYYGYDRAESQAGYSAGFDDAEYGRDYGYSAAVAPGSSTDLPPTRLQLFDLTTGEMDWTIDVDEAAGSSVYYLMSPSFEAGGTMMAMVAILGEPGTYDGVVYDTDKDHVLFSIDVRDGTYKTRDFSSTVQVVAVAGDIVAVVSDETVSAYRLSDIDGAAVWQADALRNDYGYNLLPGFVGTQWVLTDDGYVSIDDGKSAGFGSDVSASIGYFQAEDGAVYRWENSGSGSDDSYVEITKWDIGANKAAWNAPVDVTSAVGAGVSGRNLLTFDQESKKVVAYSTSTGEQDWSQRLAGQDLGYDVYYTVVKTDSWFAYTTSAARIELADSATGETRASIRPSCDAASYANLLASPTALYVDCDGALTAYEAAGKNAGDERWSLGLRTNETVVWFVDQIGLQTRNDDGSVTIRLLSAK